MGSNVHVPFKTETTSVWTDEMHVQFLKTMEASFIRKMLQQNRDGCSRLKRQLPDKKIASSDSMVPSTKIASSKRTRRRLIEVHNSSLEQVVPQLENGKEGASASCVAVDVDEEHSRSD
ncbi:uncharacterized protein [Cicer arietinum]|uniref:Uncharacterized protein LOC101504477 n=1 Tax=Cicer arietinum TaxID=3827 RepID=A0A1S2XYP9_CICAR|nr:uncharacterized protein LOC101504477 [Cicer arietinum]